jgi:hypothetical protein
MNYLILRGMNEMKKTKEIQENIIEETLKFTSREDAEEFKSIAKGRKFCKKGERLQDICMQEIERSNYKKSRNIFVKIFKHSKFKSEKLLLEKRTSSIIRTVAKECINNSEEEIDINKLVKQVKEIILENAEKYLKNLK